MQKNTQADYDFFNSQEKKEFKKIEKNKTNPLTLNKVWYAFKDFLSFAWALFTFMITLCAIIGLPVTLVYILYQDGKYETVQKIKDYTNSSKESFDFNMKALNIYASEKGYIVTYDKNTNNLSVQVSLTKNTCKQVANKYFSRNDESLKTININEMVITKDTVVNYDKNNILCNLDSNKVVFNYTALKN